MKMYHFQKNARHCLLLHLFFAIYDQIMPSSVTVSNYVFGYPFKKTLQPLFMDGVQLPEGQSHLEEAVYLLPLSSQKFLVLQYQTQSIFGDTVYLCYGKLRLVTPPPPLVGAEEMKIFDLDNPRLLEKAFSGKELH